MSVVFVSVLILLAGMLLVLAVLVALLVTLTRRRSQGEQRHTARVSRELERVDAMTATGRITAEEAAELRQALEDQRPPAGLCTASGQRLQKGSAPLICGVCSGLGRIRHDFGGLPSLERLR